MTYSAEWSPLRYKQSLDLRVHDLPSHDKLRQREDSFVCDAVKTKNHNRVRRLPIIPDYDARADRSAVAYFQTPQVKATIAVTIDNKNPRTPRTNTINKLSTRRRCPRTPPRSSLEDRETSFVSDAIETERRRTKYKDTLLPQYDASRDPHARTYIGRPDVKKLMASTRSLPLGSDGSMSSRSSSQGSSHKSLSENGKRRQVKLISTSLPECPLAESPRVGRRSLPPQPGRGRQELTYPPELLNEREMEFRNDAVHLSYRKTRFWDVLPPYDARADFHATSYFKKPHVKKLLTVTCA